jgi:hypothetical protein
MFPLEQSITEWRQQMLAAGIKMPVPLEELEIHLREEFEQQMKSGLPGQEAFEISARRIGQPETLRMEFMKTARPGKAQLRRRAGYFYAATLAFYSSAASLAILKQDATFSQRLLGFSGVLTTVLSVYLAWQIVPRLTPVISQKFHGVAGMLGGISGAVWFVAFMYLILPRFDFTPGQLVVAILWATLPMLVLPTVSFLEIEKSESRPTVS